MSMQRSDTITIDNDRHYIIALTKTLPFYPGDFGIKPAPTNTYCLKNCHCNYVIVDEHLYLDMLYIVKDNSPDFSINGSMPALEGDEIVYHKLMIPMDYTGHVLLGMNFIWNYSVDEGFLPAWSYENVTEAVFEKGLLKEIKDHTSYVKELRENNTAVQLEEEYLHRSSNAEYDRKCFSLSFHDKAWWIKLDIPEESGEYIDGLYSKNFTEKFHLPMPFNPLWTKSIAQKEYLRVLIAAAEKNDSKYQYIVGRIYDGIKEYISSEYKEDFNCWIDEDISDPGYYASLFDTIPQDFPEAVKWYKKTAANGNVEAMRRLGFLLDLEKKYEESVQWYEKAVDAKDIISMLELGNRWFSSPHYDHNYAKAAGYLKSALPLLEKCGNPRVKTTIAYYLLGKIYDQGDEYLNRDENEARFYYRELFRKVSGSGEGIGIWDEENADPEMIRNRYEGNLIDYLFYPDESMWEKGDALIRWLTSQEGYEKKPTGYRLGLIYEFGLLDVEKNIDKAIDYYSKAWDYGWPEYRLGYLYETGVKVEKDLTKSLHWYRRCAEMYYSHRSPDSYLFWGEWLYS